MSTDISPKWTCLAPSKAACAWPDCGCDPEATKVIAALVEQGWQAPKEVEAILARSSEQADEATSYHKFWIEERDKRLRAEANHKDVVETKRITDARLKWALAGLQRIYNEATETQIVEIAGEAFEKATHENPRRVLVSSPVTEKTDG
jgi:hypothetical protein